MSRVMIRLEPQERDALLILAQQEKRDPRQQAALLVCESLRARGLLPVNSLATDCGTAQRQEVCNAAAN